MELKEQLQKDRAERQARAAAAVEKFMLREKVILEMRKAKPEEPEQPWYKRKMLSPMQALAGMAAVAAIAVVTFSLMQIQMRGAPQGKEALMPVEFTYYAPNATHVEIAGDFVGWQTGKHKLTKGADGNWHLKLMLPPGRYQYQFVIDGSWTADPSCPARVSDDFGRENSLLIL
ncbi:MAG: glycogen-binding domain-containing protein [Turneriella sp.]